MIWFQVVYITLEIATDELTPLKELIGTSWTKRIMGRQESTYLLFPTLLPGSCLLAISMSNITS